MLKQIILIRRDLKMRRGKECSQAAHASMAFIIKSLQSNHMCPHLWDWINEGQTKITLQVSTEKELLYMYEEGKKAGLLSYLITDSGKTEFHGNKNYTAVAIGPNKSEDIDRITGKLKLY